MTGPAKSRPPLRFSWPAKFLPALARAVPDGATRPVAARRTLPWLYVARGAGVRRARADRRRRLHSRRWSSLLALIDGALAVTARGAHARRDRSILQPARLLREGNALLNIGFAVASVGGSALGGLLISEFGLAAALLVDAASFLAIAMLLALTRICPPRRASRRRRSSGSGAGSRSRGRIRASGCCWAASRSRSSSSR